MLSYALVAVFSVLLAVLFVPRDWSLRPGAEAPQGPRPARLLRKQELSLYDGEEASRGLYLAILGQVFDVSKGRKHYGPGGAYHSLAGDAPVLVKCSELVKLNTTCVNTRLNTVCTCRQRCLTGLHHWRLHRAGPDR